MTPRVERSVEGLAATVRARAGVEVTDLFDAVVAEDVLPHVLHTHLFIPGVAATSDLSGPWDTPGSTRTVHLTNGATATERLDAFERPDLFSYTVSDFTGPFGRIVDHAVGSWRFDRDGAGSRFTWTYRFIPRPRCGPLVAVIVRTAWAGYMQRAASRCADRADSP
jgi:hypothetical protein